MGRENKPTSHCDKYNLEQDRWENGPWMNYTRAGHSSCAFQLTVYVFCGVHQLDMSTNSIEKLDTSKYMARWQLIHVAESVLIPRYWPIAAMINPTEIVIMGGVDDSDKKLGDVVYFDVRKETCKKVIADGLRVFSTSANETIVYRRNAILAMAEAPMGDCGCTKEDCENDDKLDWPLLFKYAKGDKYASISEKSHNFL